MKSTKILLFDTQPLTQAGLYSLITSENDLQIQDCVSDRQTFFKSLSRTIPEVLIIDPYLPKSVNIDEINIVKKDNPGLNILIISSREPDRDLVVDILSIEASGFLSKNSTRGEILKAIYIVIDGKKYFKNAMYELISIHKKGVCSLSSRELQVLKYIASGSTTGSIAKSLGISPHTVNSHRKNIHSKLKITSPFELLKHALNLGLLDIDSYSLN